MALSDDSNSQVKSVATEALNTFVQVANRANSELRTGGLDASAFASLNTLTSVDAVNNLDEINFANLQGNQVLAREPSIARVTVLVEGKDKRVYYICRGMPVSGVSALMASYKSPVGRLAAMPTGSDFVFPNGEIGVVVDRTRLRPNMVAGEWDSIDSVFENEEFGPITVESFRVLLRQVLEQAPVRDVLTQFLAEDAAAANIIEGVRRSIIKKMGLRDQPVLDQYQDEIFRLPLDQRLLILGPPGTGKTTTLIRRLGQKLNVEFLTVDEQSIVSKVDSSSTVHSDSWLMFTPTELLKQYLKEAFNREGVPASDHRIKTWHAYRRDLARNRLGILRTGGAGGTFTLKDAAKTLSESAATTPTLWFADFDRWQRQAFLQGLAQSTHVLIDSKEVDIATLGKRVAEIVAKAQPTSIPELFLNLSAAVATVQPFVAALRISTDNKIKEALNLAMNSDSSFLDELGKFIDQMQVATDADADDQDDQDGEDDDPTIPKTGRGAAITAYLRAVRAQARAQAGKRSLRKLSRNAKIAEWLGNRSIAAKDVTEVGAQLLVLSAVRGYTNPVKRYVDGVPKRYRTFRREQQEAANWYAKEDFSSTDLHPLELDLILLSTLRAAGELLKNRRVSRRLEEPFWSSLKTIQSLYMHQVLVDEATDFSPIQLACMAELAHPDLRSFFACGDFNQRLTTWGSRTAEDVRWVFPDLEIREVSVSYRQSRQLNELARAIIHSVGGADQHMSLPPHVDSEGRQPALLENADGMTVIVDWLAERVCEIESFLDQLPSTAIFVNSEEEVRPLAEALNTALEDSNIRVVACPDGQVMGLDNDIRVFDIQHIKGLEFEAVFFIGVDRLAAARPVLFDKYLYVGTTRAATYLGITCEKLLPKAMESLRTHFQLDWTAASN